MKTKNIEVNKLRCIFESTGADDIYNGFSRCKRSRVEIIADILKAAQAGKRKTNLLYMSNLSYSSLSSYLKSLLGTGLLEEKNVKKDITLYKTTDKGNEFLSNYRILSQTMNTKGIDL